VPSTLTTVAATVLGSHAGCDCASAGHPISSPVKMPPARTAASARVVGIAHGVALQQGLDHQVTVVPVGMVKGLELDATVVVEPAAIVEEEPQGMRALYVALTRATKILTVVHARRLPSVLEGADAVRSSGDGERAGPG